ncbi:3-isopropylmalate dehydrogenase [Comamonas testosteroni]|uniref:3-isopropylmalate dehydrogenase n=1 Tax=Comamonas testosteroni TaxID=285 RepID=A0A5A7MEF9_COMTE|nr:isocitrate/isopropylmalate dehydrogenase family protein [Comamonas testosteroni]GEQ75311.1 3-isopropylmalate dehydrogenase [Comamonas testosteroni]
MSKYYIASIAGDGIGPEVNAAAIQVMREACGENILEFQDLPGGANYYKSTGVVVPNETYDGCVKADAILHGAAGLPGVTYPDGTEAGNDLHLVFRFDLDLYANVRPIKLLKGIRSPLLHYGDKQINYVIVRENTEGLYASRGGGIVLRDELAADTLLITKKGAERVAKVACQIANNRNGAPKDGKRRVTVCDKANILRSYAFFREKCTDVISKYSDIEADYAYVDAMTLYMVQKPDFYDVIVTENMFGDIISDLGAASIGGLGLAPSAEIGDNHALFQGAHGSAPDIAGKNLANPIATVLSGAMLLNWLGTQRGDEQLIAASKRIETAVEQATATGRAMTRDLGGSSSCTDVTLEICRQLK